MRATFGKDEKLCGQLRITALYKEGRRFVVFPMRVNMRLVPASSAPVKVLIWAPKSLFKHAVDRNHLRRLMREAYRLEKEPLETYCAEHGCSMELAFNYIDKDRRDQLFIRKAMRKAIGKLTKEADNV